MASARIDKMGPVTVPPTTVSTDGDSLVATCDPAIAGMLLAFKTILLTKLDATWIKAAKGISAHVVDGTYATEPIHPNAVVTWAWPALFMWRVSEREFRRTQYWNDSETTGKLSYILPPLPLDHLARLEPIRVAVRAALVSFVEHYGDPSYATGANIISAQGLETFTFTEARYGYLPTELGLELLHPTLDLTWTMRERSSDVVTGYTGLSDISTHVYAAGDGTDTTAGSGATAGTGETFLFSTIYVAT
jgi:hypothetical protein